MLSVAYCSNCVMNSSRTVKMVALSNKGASWYNFDFFTIKRIICFCIRKKVVSYLCL